MPVDFAGVGEANEGLSASGSCAANRNDWIILASREIFNCVSVWGGVAGVSGVPGWEASMQQLSPPHLQWQELAVWLFSDTPIACIVMLSCPATKISINRMDVAFFNIS